MLEYEEVIIELIDRRKRAGLSQAKLASIMGTSQSGLWAIENGRTTCYLTTLQRMAEAVGCELKFELIPKPKKVQDLDLDQQW